MVAETVAGRWTALLPSCVSLEGLRCLTKGLVVACHCVCAFQCCSQLQIDTDRCPGTMAVFLSSMRKCQRNVSRDSVMVTIFKEKGGIQDSGNYRGIPLCACVWSIICLLLNFCDILILLNVFAPHF